MDICWTLIPGGICRFGDEGRPIEISPLLWTTTLVSDPASQEPLTRVTNAEAVLIAAELGGRLPRSSEWEWMAAGPKRRRYPWGDEPWRPELGNLRASGLGQPCPVGLYPEGATPLGLLDVAGNAWEWTSSSAMGDGYVIRGGSFASLPLYAQSTFLNAAPAELRSRGLGLRVVREP
jgi:sulfatase modifying factor 1